MLGSTQLSGGTYILNKWAVYFIVCKIMEYNDSTDAYAFKTYAILLKLEIVTLTNQIKSLTDENKTLKHSLACNMYDTIEKTYEKNDAIIN